MEVKKIKIYGSEGYVGKAVINLLKDHYEILKDDPVYFRELTGKQKAELLSESGDMAVVCVPTLMDEDGSCDVSIVREVVSRAKEPLILIKSTIPPGTTEKLKLIYNKRICFSPEYLGEGRYVVPFWKGYPDPKNMKRHDFQIFGGEKKDTREIIEVFQRILGPVCRYIQTDSTTAELTKYMENAWNAMKVTFCNEFCNISEFFGVDYHELRELFLLDNRVERMHTSVFREKPGFDGKCLPKDNMAIIKFCEEKGYVPHLLKEVLKSNERFLSQNKKGDNNA